MTNQSATSTLTTDSLLSASRLVQAVTTTTVMLTSHMGAGLYVLPAPLSIQLPVEGLGGQCLGLCTHIGDVDEVPGCWPRPRPIMATVAIWVTTQWIEDLCVSPLSVVFSIDE